MRIVTGGVGALLVAIIAMLFLSGGDPPDYRVPEQLWEVDVFRSETLARPILIVTVSDEFEWPRPPGNTNEDIYYRVDVQIPGAERAVEGVGQITKEERFSVVALLPGLVGRLVQTDSQRERLRLARINKVDVKIEKLEAIGPADITFPIVDIEDILVTFGELDIFERGAEVLNYSISLAPMVSGRAVLRQEVKGKQAKKKKYTWGTAVTDAKDPCKGKKPEDCVSGNIAAFLKRLCAEKKDNSLRFTKECKRLRMLLANAKIDKSPRFNIQCKLPLEGKSKGGIVAGETAGDGSIDINGTDQITAPCPEITLLHELKHSLDFADPNKFKTLKKFKELERKIDAGKKEFLKEAKKNFAAFQKAKAKYAGLVKQIKKIEIAAGGELITAECDALFFTIEHADFFGYPKTKIGVKCMKANVKSMIDQVVGIHNRFNLPDKSPEMCTCLKRIEKYVNSQEKIKNNFDKDLFDDPKENFGDLPDRTWSKLLKEIIGIHCQK